ncbi:MAG: hypothetical protein D3906_03740, partial [Candidatus Electrothrix sp. AUS1_2]|nr:hypothetical protein [Candidatus Electrothrix sp. AUS1_2]
MLESRRISAQENLLSMHINSVKNIRKKRNECVKIMGKFIGTGDRAGKEESQSFRLCPEQPSPEKVMNPDKPEEPYKDRYSLLENLRE